MNSKQETEAREMREKIEYLLMRARYWLDMNDSLNNTTLACLAVGEASMKLGEQGRELMNTWMIEEGSEL
jgi:hypothetical protein